MKSIMFMVLGAAILLSGCATADKVTTGYSSVIGHPVAALIKAHEGHRIRIFDKEGKELEKLPSGCMGSVSIYNKEMTGQDNYIFGKDGNVVKHLRSYGDNYSEGVWKEAK